METRSDVRKKSQKFSVKRLALLAILTALCYVGRIVFQFIPNVQPMTTILLLITLNLTITDGLIVAAASLILSNMVLGMGPWLFPQLITYFLLLGFAGIFLKPLYGKGKKNTRFIFTAYSFLNGLLFGFIISIFSYNMYGMTNFWVYYLMGISFDLMHAAGNAGFYLILEPILAPLLHHQMRKIH
ncbi:MULTISPECIES: ECF transporter S component [unclassified Jeotgalibaca]|uniref:ECF transporter S component n=1 Tax=unclassified Jeotgalibaca TaxID=2621505 RepID=UPI003FD238BC